jgi:hypothetical protein
MYFAGLCQTLKNKVHAYFAALSQTQKSSIQRGEKFEKYNQMVHIKKRTTTHIATQMFHEKSSCYRLRVSSNLMSNTFHSLRKQLTKLNHRGLRDFLTLAAVRPIPTRARYSHMILRNKKITAA